MDQWTPINFQEIIALDPKLIHQIETYLIQKESQLAKNLVKLVTLNEETLFFSNTPVKLHEAIKIIHEKVREMITHHRLPKSNWETLSRQINHLIWEYAEILKNCALELFQQIRQVDLKDWQTTLLSTTIKIKDLLNHHLEVLARSVEYIKAELEIYRELCQNAKKWRFFRKFFNFWQPILDENLVSNIKKDQKFLSFQHKNFTDRFNHYMSLKAQIEESVKKFSPYEVLQQLDVHLIQHFTQLYEQIKLWEENLKAKSLPTIDVSKSIRQFLSLKQAIHLFEEYFQAVKNKLFELSRQLKTSTLSKELIEEELHIIEPIHGEIHRLASLIAKYRHFLLQTDSNPYVRSRWGFSEWVTGPEPFYSKILLQLGYEVEDLGTLFKNFQNSLEKHSLEIPDFEKAKEEITFYLHEMSQPLNSMSNLKTLAEKILRSLSELDELSSFDPEVVYFTSQTLSQLFRFDWKYHVLFDIPAFESLYQTHLNILEPIYNRQHLNRFNKFKALTRQILNWTKTYTDQNHIQEIESDVNDIKGYLQDFFASIQRHCTQKNNEQKYHDFIDNAKQELLEYRYLFGQFFHQLRQSQPNERILRNQFLFVDQYFEAIEILLSNPP